MKYHRIYEFMLLFDSFFVQILLQQNCDKIQPLQQKTPNDYNLAMMVGALFSCFGIILILLAFVLWR